MIRTVVIGSPHKGLLKSHSRHRAARAARCGDRDLTGADEANEETAGRVMAFGFGTELTEQNK